MKSKEITLSSGLKFFIVPIPNGLESEPAEVRLFIPDWNNILKSPELYTAFKEHYPKNEVSSAILPLLVEYYQYCTLLPPGKKYKSHPYDKLTRKFEMDSLIYLTEFNHEIKESIGQRNPTKLEIYKYFKELGVNQKKYSIDQIGGNLVKYFYQSSTETLPELISHAFIDNIKVAQPYTPLGYLKYINIELQKVIKIINHFSSAQRKSDFYTQAELKTIHDFLKCDALMESLYTNPIIERNTKEANRILNRIDWQDNFVSGQPYAKSRGQDNAPIGYDDSEALKIVNEIKIELESVHQNQKKGSQKGRIKKIISALDEHLSFPLNHRWVGLVYIKNLFADQRIARKYLLKEIEEHFNFYLRKSAKKSLELLIKEQKLSKPEIRLFILHNVGVKKFKYLTPWSDPPLVYFFNYCKYGLYLFTEVVLKKNRQPITSDIYDWEWYLESQFKSYLLFYKVFVEIIRESEREDKRRKSNLPKKYPPKTQNSLSENSAQIEDCPPESNKPEDPPEQTEEIIIDGDGDQSRDEYPPKFRLKTPSFLLNMSSDEHGPFLIEDFLAKILTADELVLFKKLVFDEEKEEILAKSYGVSHQSINKRKQAMIKKIKDHPEFNNLFSP